LCGTIDPAASCRLHRPTPAATRPSSGCSKLTVPADVHRRCGAQEFTSLSKPIDAATSGDYAVISTRHRRACGRFPARARQTQRRVRDPSSACHGPYHPAWGLSQGMEAGVKCTRSLDASDRFGLRGALSDFFSAIDAMAPDIRATNLLAQRCSRRRPLFLIRVSISPSPGGEGLHDELARAGFTFAGHRQPRLAQWTLPDSAPRAGGAQGPLNGASANCRTGTPQLADVFTRRAARCNHTLRRPASSR